MLVGAGAWRCVLIGLALLTLALHIAQIVWYQPAAQRGSAARPSRATRGLSPAASTAASTAAFHSPTVETARTLCPRGVATSGRGGRSQSLGIADSVTVLAISAAMADAAATMIANKVDLPGHPAVERQPAFELSPDSDLGDRLVTVGLGDISEDEALQALERGAAHAEKLLERGLIGAAQLWLAGQGRMVAPRLHDPALAADAAVRAGSQTEGPEKG